jgi:hypothetical protein
MNSRRVALLVMLCALLILLIAPVVMLDRPDAKTNDPAYRQLDVIARSLNGDHSADLEAAEALGEVEQQRRGSNTVYRATSGESCWELDLSAAEKPYRIRC